MAEDAIAKLVAADPDDRNGIVRQQSIVSVCQDLPQMLRAIILRTGEADGGVTA